MKRVSARFIGVPLAMALAIAVLWAFPAFWYNNPGEGQMRWLTERTDLPDWQFRSIPVDQSAEKVLVADRTFNGEFTNSLGTAIHVFSAKRYDEKANEIGLFIHTPDRCWVEAGWRIEDAEPTFKEINLHDAVVAAERRIFVYNGTRELVYFFGLQDGRSLPYRLDHYLSTGHRFGSTGSANRELIRASDLHFWNRLWDSFKSRRQLRGPKQFVRISTTLGMDEVSAADERLEKFLHEWLVPGDYNAEKKAWKFVAANPARSTE